MTFWATIDGDRVEIRNRMTPLEEGMRDSIGELTKIFIERQDESFFSFGPLQNSTIFATWRICTNPNYIMPTVAQCIDCLSWEILVGQDSHYLLAPTG
jgi:hypothetical protein